MINNDGYNKSFSQRERMKEMADEGSWHVYHIRCGEFLLLILCTLLPYLWKAIKKDHSLPQRLWEKKAIKINYDFSSQNLKMWSTCNFTVRSDHILWQRLFFGFFHVGNLCRNAGEWEKYWMRVPDMLIIYPSQNLFSLIALLLNIWNAIKNIATDSRAIGKESP